MLPKQTSLLVIYSNIKFYSLISNLLDPHQRWNTNHISSFSRDEFQWMWCKKIGLRSINITYSYNGFSVSKCSYNVDHIAPYIFLIHLRVSVLQSSGLFKAENILILEKCQLRPSSQPAFRVFRWQWCWKHLLWWSGWVKYRKCQSRHHPHAKH